jgi:hypothetical protein
MESWLRADKERIAHFKQVRVASPQAAPLHLAETVSPREADGFAARAKSTRQQHGWMSLLRQRPAPTPMLASHVHHRINARQVHQKRVVDSCVDIGASPTAKRNTGFCFVSRLPGNR